MPDLCETFRKEAGGVWKRMATAASLGLSLSEETLTEMSLYNIALVHQGKDIVINLATKREEKKHGADWEWWFVKAQSGIGFRVQAKRLFASGRYENLRKVGKRVKKNPYKQLDTLVAASRREHLQPLYCFFNFDTQPGQFNRLNAQCIHSYRGPSFWGCSLAFPDQIKETQSDQLKKLQPVMFPWHTLVCGSDQMSVVSAATQFVADCGQPGRASGQRNLPHHVRRLIELGRERRRQPDQRRYLDDVYRDDHVELAEGVSGLFVVEDLRD